MSAVTLGIASFANGMYQLGLDGVDVVYNGAAISTSSPANPLIGISISNNGLLLLLEDLVGVSMDLHITGVMGLVTCGPNSAPSGPTLVMPFKCRRRAGDRARDAMVKTIVDSSCLRVGRW